MPRSSHRRTRRIVAVIALAAGLAGLAGTGELVARRAWSDPQRPPRPVIPPGRWPKLKSLGDTMRPNHAGVFHRAFFRTNSKGFRGPEWSHEPAPGTVRILAVGDSVVLGAGVDEADRYTDRAARRLAEDPSLPPVEIVNLGAGGANAAFAVKQLKLGLRTYAGTDVTLYAWNIDDIRDAHFETRTTAAQRHAAILQLKQLETWRSVLLRTVVPVVRDAFERVTGTRAIDDLYANHIDGERAWQALQRAIEQLAEINRQHGTCGLVLLQTRLVDLGPSHPYRDVYDRVAGEVRRHGLTVVDAYPHFAWTRALPLWVGPYDTHPNARGHEILAAALEEGIRSLPDGCLDPERSGPERGDGPDVPRSGDPADDG